MITLKHFRGFVAVNDTLHFTNAARALYLSQPALSTLISQLEDELGVQLIARTTRAVNITPIGKEFAATARKVLAEFDSAISSMKGVLVPMRGRVTLAALPSLSGTILPGIIAEYRRTYPQVEIHIRDLVSDDLIAALLGGSVDFALGHSQSSRDIRAQPLLRDRLVVICTREFATGTRDIRWRDLADRPIVALAHGTTIRSLVQSAALAKGVTLQIATEVRQLSTAIACAAAGVGIAIVPSTGLPETLPPSLVQLNLVDPIVHRELSLLTHARTHLSPVATALYNAVLTAMTKLQRRRRRVG